MSPAPPPRPVFVPEPSPAPVHWTWHVAAVLGLSVAAWLNVRGWFASDAVPKGDAGGYIAVVEYVRDAVLRYGRVPAWNMKWFAGSTQFMSSLKELATFPLAVWLGPVLGTKVMFLVMKAAAAIGMYAFFVRLLAAPAAGLVAGYAYACGAPANYQAALFGHLDAAVSYAIFPPLFLATVETVRTRRVAWAIALGVLLACQFSTHYAHGLAWPAMAIALIALRPWRPAADAETRGAAILDRRRMALLATALGVFVLFAASPLAWLAADSAHHALNPPSEIAAGLERFSEQSPFLYVNRSGWLGDWLRDHRPAGLMLRGDPDITDPFFDQRRYLGLVALATVLVGWWAARRRFSLRRWYQAFALLFLAQYGLSMGPHPIVWQIARAFHWNDETEATVAVLLLLGAAACFVWAGILVVRRARAAADARLQLRIEAALVSALGLFLVSQPLFTVVEFVLPVLRGVRSPGHFFDLAPFALYGMLGVALVAIGRTLRDVRLRRAAVAAVGLAVVLDFWPSAQAFYRVNPIDSLREFQSRLSNVPGEGGTLRMAVFPWYSPSDWVNPTLLALASDVGGAWSWLAWQAGPTWESYLRAATLPLITVGNPEERERFRPTAEVLQRIARFKYVLEEFEPTPRLAMEAPWRLRERNDRYALWERPDVLPMASAYRGSVLAVGGAETVILVERAARTNLVVLSKGDRLADVPPAVIDGAALVVARDPRDLADPPSARLAERYATKVFAGAPGDLYRRWDALVPSRAPSPLEVRYTRPAPEHIVLEMDGGAAAAVVFVSESYHPWWTATVDGASAPVLRAGTAFMAVPVGPGPHVVDLRLRPPLAVVVADGTTRLAWVMLPVAVVALAVAGRRRR